MKIDDSLAGVPSIGSNKKTRSKGRSGTSTGTSSTSGSDNVDITDASARLSKLESALGQVDTSEPGRLEAVRQAIAEGHFEVDEEAVADALLQSSLDQMKRQGGK